MIYPVNQQQSNVPNHQNQLQIQNQINHVQPAYPHNPMNQLQYLGLQNAHNDANFNVNNYNGQRPRNNAVHGPYSTSHPPASGIIQVFNSTKFIDTCGFATPKFSCF